MLHLHWFTCRFINLAGRKMLVEIKDITLPRTEIISILWHTRLRQEQTGNLVWKLSKPDDSAGWETVMNIWAIRSLWFRYLAGHTYSEIHYMCGFHFDWSDFNSSFNVCEHIQDTSRLSSPSDTPAAVSCFKYDRTVSEKLNKNTLIQTLGVSNTWTWTTGGEQQHPAVEMWR